MTKAFSNQTDYVPLAAALTLTNYNGGAVAASAVITLANENANIPTGVKALVIYAMAKDETVGVQFGVGRDASFTIAVVQHTQVANQYVGVAGVVPVTEDGKIYFYCSGELDNVYVRVTGWWV